MLAVITDLDGGWVPNKSFINKSKPMDALTSVQELTIWTKEYSRYGV